MEKERCNLVSVLLCITLLLPSCQDRELSISLGSIPGHVEAVNGHIALVSPSILADSNEFVWGCSCVKGEDGKYHLFYSMFEAGAEKPSFSDSWLLSSKIAHAVSDHPDRAICTHGYFRF